MTDISMDKKYRTRDGREVRLYAVNGGGNYPVHGAIDGGGDAWHLEAWAIDGKQHDDAPGPQSGDLIEINPYDHLRKGDRVLVSIDGGSIVRRYFSHVGEDGRPHAFINGATEWSSSGNTWPWNYCEAWTGDDD